MSFGRQSLWFSVFPGGAWEQEDKKHVTNKPCISMDDAHDRNFDRDADRCLRARLVCLAAQWLSQVDSLVGADSHRDRRLLCDVAQPA